ncbi:MAG: hypothetical protein KC478_00975 [Bacteriovoracaceae bacterium]|nr:hypothetical protein [Bacteriovoracaceae bacterium]
MNQADNYSVSSNCHSLMNETIELLPAYVENLKDFASTVAQSLEFKDQDLELGKLADKLSSMISLFTSVHGDCKLLSRDPQAGNKVFRMVKIHLLSILKAIQSASQHQDRVMLADLLEYELQDNLTQWKISAIPLLKQMIQTK